MRARTTASARYDLGLAIKTIGHQRCAKALILRLLGIPDVCTCIVRPARKKRGVATSKRVERGDGDGVPTAAALYSVMNRHSIAVQRPTLAKMST